MSVFASVPLSSSMFLRSEEHTSELQSRQYLVCRLLLEQKKCGRDLIASHACSRPSASSALPRKPWRRFTCSARSIAFFVFHDTPTTEIYTLSLHDALPISCAPSTKARVHGWVTVASDTTWGPSKPRRSEEHTSELQSRQYLVCRLLLE